MKKGLILGLFSLLVFAISGQTSFYDLKVTDIDGKVFNFADLKGKKVLIVNTASKCRTTKQYEMLQVLYEKYGKDKFVILGFPANNFNDTEPGENADIRKFCSLNYHVNFPLMSKCSVKGDDMCEVYKWLTSKDLNGVMDSEVKWNFQKYLINEDGSLENVLAPNTKPYHKDIINWIENKS